MSKSESKKMMEKSILDAVYHMATESLNPDEMDNLEEIIESLKDRRHLKEIE